MIFDLQREVTSLLESGFSNPRFTVPDKPEPGKVNIHTGSLPPKRSQSDPAGFPYVVINTTQGEDKEGQSYAVVLIHLGAHVNGDFSQENIRSGMHEIQNMVQRARRILLETRKQNNYTLKDIKWQLGGDNGEQYFPEFLGLITTRWELPLIQKQLTEKEHKFLHG